MNVDQCNSNKKRTEFHWNHTNTTPEDKKNRQIKKTIAETAVKPGGKMDQDVFMMI